MSRLEKHVTTRPCHVRKKKMLHLTHLICIIRSTRYLDDKPCHFFSNKSMSQDMIGKCTVTRWQKNCMQSSMGM